MKILTFFNNKGGVGKTTLVYHLAWAYSNLGYRVLVADFDPQANLSGMFLDEEELEGYWPEGEHPGTVLGALRPLIRGIGDIATPTVHCVPDSGIGIIVGDMGLSTFEDELSTMWPRCLGGEERAFRVVSAFYRLLVLAGRSHNADLVVMDIGPNLGAINRAALVATDHVVIPMAADLFSLQGLKNLGPTLRQWRTGWKERLQRAQTLDVELPDGKMEPAGYVVLQHAIRTDREPAKAYKRWMERIPAVYRVAVLGEEAGPSAVLDPDPHCLSKLKNYRSLMPMAQDARKPVFQLKPADGAIGSHAAAVKHSLVDFEQLAHAIATRSGLPAPHAQPE